MQHPQASTQLGYKATQSLYYAIGEMAQAVGLPLTLAVTINFSVAGVPPEKAVALFQKLRLLRFGKWALRPTKSGGAAFVPTYAYVFENRRDGVAFTEIGPGLDHNVHVHWSVHIPAQRVHAFKAMMHQWMDSLTDSICPSNTIRFTPIYNTPTLRGYAIKGANAAWAERFGAKAIDQGLIVGGRRSGTSTNLAVSARRRYDKANGIKRQAGFARGTAA